MRQIFDRARTRVEDAVEPRMFVDPSQRSQNCKWCRIYRLVELYQGYDQIILLDYICSNSDCGKASGTRSVMSSLQEMFTAYPGRWSFGYISDGAGDASLAEVTRLQS